MVKSIPARAHAAFGALAEKTYTTYITYFQRIRENAGSHFLWSNLHNRKRRRKRLQKEAFAKSQSLRAFLLTRGTFQSEGAREQNIVLEVNVLMQILLELA
jgi:hypothetical protein